MSASLFRCVPHLSGRLSGLPSFCCEYFHTFPLSPTWLQEHHGVHGSHIVPSTHAPSPAPPLSCDPHWNMLALLCLHEQCWDGPSALLTLPTSVFQHLHRTDASIGETLGSLKSVLF